MATDLVIRTAPVKQQSMWAWLGLTFITLGIYNFFWYFRVNRELRDAGGAFGDAELGESKPGMSALAQFIPIANLVSLHRTGKRIGRMQAAIGQPVTYSLGIHWILALFTGLWPMYAQTALNTIWLLADRAAQTAVPAEPTAPTPFL